MNKIVRIGTSLVSMAVVVLSVLYFVAGIRLPGLQQLLLSVFMLLLAYNHVQQKKERDLTFWLLIIAAAFNFVVAFIIIQPFF